MGGLAVPKPDREGVAQAGANAAAVPTGAPAWITPQLVALTLRIWQPFYTKAQLSPADAVQMLMSVGRLCAVLGGR